MADRKVYRGSAVLIITLLVCSSCGYRVRSSVGSLPSGVESLGIPTFRNLTNQYKIEQLVTSAVLKEFSARTRIPVSSAGSGVDAVLQGEILDVGAVPVTFGSDSFGSAFLVTVRISARLVNVRNSTVIWQGDFPYRERYVLNSVVRDFFSEENPALQRLSKDFAASLVSTILENRKP